MRDGAGRLCGTAHRDWRRGHTLLLFVKGTHMLNTIVIVLVILWLLGVSTAFTAGGLIHILLVIAIVVVLLRVIQGRNPLRG
jgi:hypothetical protein